MPHLIPKSTNQTALFNRNANMLSNPDWKAVGWPGDPTYHVQIDQLEALYAAGVPARYVKAVDIGGGTFQAQEMNATEKNVVDLPGAKQAKQNEIKQVEDFFFNDNLDPSLSQVWPRPVQHLPAQKAALSAQVTAATTVAQVNAIIVAYPPPAVGDEPPGPSDYLHVFLNADGPSANAAAGWALIGGATTSQKSGNTFTDVNGSPQNNYISTAKAGNYMLSFGATVQIVSVAQVNFAISVNNAVPTAAARRTGFSVNGAAGDFRTGSSSLPIVAAVNDVFRLWMEVVGNPAAGAIPLKFYLTATYI